MTEVHYGTLSERNVLDVYRPNPARNTETAIVLLHGGGFRKGSKERVRARAERLADAGYCVLAANYRLFPEAAGMDALQDVALAVAWAQLHAAELGVRRERIVVQGYSAGGYLALRAAMPGDLNRLLEGTEATIEPIAGAVAMYPPVTLYPSDSSEWNPGEPTAVSGASTQAEAGPYGAQDAAIVFGRPTNAAEASYASPLDRTSADWAPTFVGHGTADTVIPAAGSIELHRRLNAVGAVTDLHMYSQQIHEFDAGGPYLDLITHEVDVFLRRLLVDPEHFAEQQRLHNPFAMPGTQEPAEKK